MRRELADHEAEVVDALRRLAAANRAWQRSDDDAVDDELYLQVYADGSMRVCCQPGTPLANDYKLGRSEDPALVLLDRATRAPGLFRIARGLGDDQDLESADEDENTDERRGAAK